MLELDMGNVREGKTMRMVDACYNVHRQNLFWNERVPFFKWVPIFTNFKVKYEEVREIDVGDLLDPDVEGVEHGLMCIDEGYTWLESRVSANKMNRYVSYFMFQSGKLDVDVMVTAQLGSTIDLRFYDLCHVQTLARKNPALRRFEYGVGVRCGVGVSFVNQFIPFGDGSFGASLYWNDYDTKAPVKPLGLEELQTEMDKFSVQKINKRVDSIVEVMLDPVVVSSMGWSDAKFVFRYQVEDLLVRWGKPLLLAPLVTNRLKTLLRS